MAKVYQNPDGSTYRSETMAVRAQKPEGVRMTAKQAKAIVVECMKKGMSIQAAMDEVGFARNSYQYWRKSDADFRELTNHIVSIRATTEGSKPDIDFPTFCQDYLDTTLFWHQLQWYDILEGREPRDLHPNQVYRKADPGMVIINTPPEHAKSTTITVNYVTYRICMDPNIRIIIVSQVQEMAKRFLRAVKDRLAGANPAYAKLQMDFAPEGGFNADSAAWTADAIYINAKVRDSGEATPTVQALGITGQIYGNRADLIIFDDTVTGKNAHEYAKQIDWIQREVINRLSPIAGMLALVGTRLAPVELYSEIQKPEWYGQDEESPWTYLTQPAVLEFADDPDDWKVLAPFTNRPPVSLGARRLVEANEHGLYPWHSGKALARRRATSSAQNWSMVYQQEQVSSDSIFKAQAVNASVDGMRAAGPMSRGAPGHRTNGMDGLYVIGGFDPALTGHSAAVVMGLDRDTQERWVLDVWTQANLKPDDLRDKIKEWTIKYRINEWRIEKNAMNMMLSQDREVNQFLSARGCILKEHFTGRNKWDHDFGVASLTNLFYGWEKKEQLLHLPKRSQNEGVKSLIEQLINWFPETKSKTDCVMALWFAEIRARELVDQIDHQVFHMDNIYATPRDKEKMLTVDLDYLSTRQNDGGEWTVL